ncbi:transposase [Pseudomonas fragariae (ex Marin et al. 2024)]|uniref:transposase n=1 Tax=Pseudomonas fragariae (ex Marin et al. 2024) TaxID=3080056 RepID=UPI003F78F392
MQPTRRSYSMSFKALVIQECALPGASIASVALRHNLNANIVHKWIRLQSQKNTALQPAFIPLSCRWLGQNPTHHHRISALKCSTRAAPSK